LEKHNISEFYRKTKSPAQKIAPLPELISNRLFNEDYFFASRFSGYDLYGKNRNVKIFRECGFDPTIRAIILSWFFYGDRKTRIEPRNDISHFFDLCSPSTWFCKDENLHLFIF